MKDFDFNTIDNFDNHIELSIPNYAQLREMIIHLSSYFIKPQGVVYDLGCSTGLLLSKLADRYKEARYVGIDTSSHLLGKYAKTENNHNISFIEKDIIDFEFEKSDLILSVFTLQFIKKYYRKTILKHIYNSLNEGGSLIIAEKIYLNSGQMQDIFSFAAYDEKKKHFTDEEILKKQMDLRFIMQPLSEQENETLLKEAGFSQVQCFFQSLLFKAWLCIK